jgi:hypothetical protein
MSTHFIDVVPQQFDAQSSLVVKSEKETEMIHDE